MSEVHTASSERGMFDRLEALILKKERGEPNTAEELAILVGEALKVDPESLTPDHRELQVVRWLRAVKKHDMLPDELANYTMALAHSGDVLNWGPRSAGKHAPGGVGENTTGPIDAIVASCNVLAPIYTGKRLLHTPGTVDRYGAIPDFEIWLTTDEFKARMERIGMAMTGQTNSCAPGDKIIYDLREKHSTKSESLVEVPALIIGSVLSKKVASGAQNIDILMTCGDGAFFKDFAEGRASTERMQAVCERIGIKVSSVLTSLHAPLGDYLATTSLAVQEGIMLLRGEEVAPDYKEAVLRVAALMLRDAGAADSLEDARMLAQKALSSGRAFEKFKKFIESQGADPRICDHIELLPRSSNTVRVHAQRDGYVWHRTRDLGNLVIRLAGGVFESDTFDPGAGIVLTPLGRHGSEVKQGDLIAVIHGSASNIEAIKPDLGGVVILGDEPPPAIERFGETILA